MIDRFRNEKKSAIRAKLKWIDNFDVKAILGIFQN